MFNITDDLSELVYVVDMNTYELLYINRTGVEIFHIDDWHGRKCYQALQGLESPCEFCTNHLLREDALYTWNFYNPVVQRYYQLKDKLIEWDGKKVRLEIAFDITELEEQKSVLENALKMENVVTSCAKKLLDLGDIRTSLDEVLKILGEFLQSDRVFIFEIKGERMNNTFEWCAPGVKPQKKNCQKMPVSLVERWLVRFEENKCVVIEDIEDIKAHSMEEYNVLSHQNIHSLIAGPLTIENRLIGYIGVDNYSVPMQQSTISLFKSVSYFIDAILRYQQIMDYDLLTGLHNRNSYMRDIKKNFVYPVGVAYIDINGMKQINDQYGHMSGDRVLTDIAGMIADIFGNVNCYRVGGDEFVVISQDIQKSVFENEVGRLEYVLKGNEEYSASVGSSWSNKPSELGQLIFQADENMYSDKKGFYRNKMMSGRYRSQFDDILGMSDPAVLREKIKAGCFQVYYQPKICISTQESDGAEALVRYRDKNGQRYSPAQFIPCLEEYRNISILDYYIFEQVCLRLKEWRDQGLTVLPVAVNFSRYTLQQDQFVENIQNIREKYDISTELLEIEVTETIEATDDEKFYKALERLQDGKFRIALDDFGVSNANLCLLTDFDFDVLKIDKYVVANIVKSHKSRLLLEALIEICAKMGIKIVAEGVETAEQVEMLRGMNCQDAQGYFFSRPISEERFRKLYLERRQRKIELRN